MALPHEEHIVNALDKLTPADVVHSARLLYSFRAFFARGSTQDVCDLVPSLEDSLAPSSGTATPLEPDRDSHCPWTSRPIVCKRGSRGCSRKAKASRGSRAQTAAAAAATMTEYPSQVTELEDAWNYFASRVPSQQRVHGLMRVLESALKAPKQPASFYKEIWSSHKIQVFCSRNPKESRISRLFQGRRLIEQGNQRFECAGRLSLVFLAHDIEVVKNHPWKLGPGQSRQHAAVISIAEHLNMNPEEIKKEWRRSRNYMRLLEVWGPASLLELGSGVNWYWEKSLTKEDVNIYIEYRKERTPHHAARIEELNRIAGEMILDGMLAYGWAREDVINSDSRLRSALATHCPDLLCTMPWPSPGISLLDPDQHQSSQEQSFSPATGVSDNFTCPLNIANVGSAERNMSLVASCESHIQQGPTRADFGLEAEMDFSKIPDASFLACDTYIAGDHSQDKRQTGAFLGNVGAYMVSVQSAFS